MLPRDRSGRRTPLSFPAAPRITTALPLAFPLSAAAGGHPHSPEPLSTDAPPAPRVIEGAFVWRHENACKGQIRKKEVGDDILGQSSVVSGQSWLLYDGHGSTRALTNPSGAITDRYSFDAYGQMLGGDPGATNAPTTDLLFSGEQYDPDLQQQYLRARYYDQSNGRFNRVDPFGGNNGDPQSLHKYAYCHSDPVLLVDPSGRAPLVGFHLELAKLSANVYKNTGAPTGWHRRAPNLTVAMGINAAFVDTNSGFYAELYTRETGSRSIFVLAFRGTQPGVDWKTNIDQALGKQTRQYDMAMDLAANAKKVLVQDYGHTLFLTGHSLGGGLASAAGVMTNLPTVVFNPAGVARKTVARRGGDIKNCSNVTA